MTYSDLWHQLLPHYDAREAQAIIRLVLDDRFQMTLTDVVMGKVDTLSASDRDQLEHDMARLRDGEPVQYVLGHATFCGRQFHVAPGVLIPRPETEQLCRLIIEETNRPYCGLQPPTPLQVLDIGTGSGCIAVTLALDLWNAEVTAWDVSPDALLIARDNAHALKANVNFELQDVLALSADNQAQSSKFKVQSSKFKVQSWDLIVSNPPYIAQKERAAMSANVLDHEPALALFAPDDDPLRFYRAIATYGLWTLRPGGRLFFEINPLYTDALRTLLASLDYQDVTITNDQFGRQRFCAAQAPLPSR